MKLKLKRKCILPAVACAAELSYSQTGTVPVLVFHVLATCKMTAREYVLPVAYMELSVLCATLAPDQAPRDLQARSSQTGCSCIVADLCLFSPSLRDKQRSITGRDGLQLVPCAV